MVNMRTQIAHRMVEEVIAIDSTSMVSWLVPEPEVEKTTILVLRHHCHQIRSSQLQPCILRWKCITWHSKDSHRRLNKDKDRESSSFRAQHQTWFLCIDSITLHSLIMSKSLSLSSCNHLRNGPSSKIAVSSLAQVLTTHSSCFMETNSKAKFHFIFQKTSHSFQTRQISLNLFLIVNSKDQWMHGLAKIMISVFFSLKVKIRIKWIVLFSQFMRNYKELELITK